MKLPKHSVTFKAPKIDVEELDDLTAVSTQNLGRSNLERRNSMLSDTIS